MRDIAAEIRTTVVPPGAVAIWWLGQFSFVVKGQGRTLGFDLYLSDYPGNVTRSFPPLVQPTELRGLDLVFCTHATTSTTSTPGRYSRWPRPRPVRFSWCRSCASDRQ